MYDVSYKEVWTNDFVSKERQANSCQFNILPKCTMFKHSDRAELEIRVMWLLFPFCLILFIYSITTTTTTTESPQNIEYVATVICSNRKPRLDVFAGPDVGLELYSKSRTRGGL